MRAFYQRSDMRKTSFLCHTRSSIHSKALLLLTLFFPCVALQYEPEHAKPTDCMCAQQSKFSLCALWVAKYLNFLHADAQADPNHRWAHMPFSWLWSTAAHFLLRCLSHYAVFGSVILFPASGSYRQGRKRRSLRFLLRIVCLFAYLGHLLG